MTSIPWPVGAVTLLLVVNAGLAGSGEFPKAVYGLSALGLVVVPWMVVHVLRDSSVAIRDLDGDEWGYQDRPDLRPL